MDFMETIRTQFDKHWLAKFLVPIVLLFIIKSLIDLILQKWKSQQSIQSAINFLPAPPSLPVVGNLRQILSVRTFKGMVTLMEKYGPIFRMNLFNFSVVVVSSASHAAYILKSTKLGHASKPKVSTSLAEPYFKDVMLSLNGPEWRSRRKVIVPTLSPRYNENYIHATNNQSKRLVQHLKIMFQDGQTHAPNNLISAHIIAIACELLTGVPLNNVEECIQHHRDFKSLGHISVRVGIRPWLAVPFIMKRHPIYQEGLNYVNSLNAFMDRRFYELQDKRREAEQNGEIDKQMTRGCLDTLIDQGFPKQLILDEAKVIIFGAYETVASTMHFFLWNLALHPEHQEACRREVDAVFEEMENSNEELTIEIVNKMKYLETCICENLRLYPVGHSITRQIDEPVTIDYKGEKKELPKGTLFLISFLGIHRNPKDFPNPEKFDPGRYSAERISQTGQQPPFLPFVGGIRSCPGMAFAMVELKIMAAHLLRYFSWTTVDKVDEIDFTISVNIEPMRDIQFKFVSRVH